MEAAAGFSQLFVPLCYSEFERHALKFVTILVRDDEQQDAEIAGNVRYNG